MLTSRTALPARADALILAIWLGVTITALAAESTSKAPPEMVALPSGDYVGAAEGKDGAREVSLSVQQGKPGGAFNGTLRINDSAPCDIAFPITGDIRPDGTVRIDAKEATRGCLHAVELKLAGSELKGFMVTANGPLKVALKKR